jgi:hypothetical protein
MPAFSIFTVRIFGTSQAFAKLPFWWFVPLQPVAGLPGWTDILYMDSNLFLEINISICDV